MAVGSMLPELLASGQVPEDILRQMEAARDPALGYTQPSRAFPQGGGMVQRGDAPPTMLQAAQPDAATMPRMEQAQDFSLGPRVPTFADLYGGSPEETAMGYGRLRQLGVPNRYHLDKVPLAVSPEDEKRYLERQKREFDLHKLQGEARRAKESEARMKATSAREARLTRLEERKAAEARQQDKLRLEGSLKAADTAIKAARKAYKDVGVLSSGFIGGITKWVPGSPALDLDEAIEPIRAITSFEQLNRMKEASRTGGALGQIAVRELELLASSVASLNTSQGPDQLKENLRKVAQHFEAWKEKVQKAWEVEGAPSTGGADGGFNDPDKERRYQEWKARQGR